MDLNTLREYINIHRISLEQDLEDAREGIEIPDDEYFESDAYYEGAIATCEHLLEYIDEHN
jgi:hypothetical protein